MKEFQNEKDTLDGLEKAEEVQKRSEGKVCDWADEREKKILKADERTADRKRKLNAIVPERVCPCCKRKIWMDSHWVIEGQLAWCRSCFHSQHKGGEETVGSIVSKIVIRVEFDGWRIKLLRSNAKVGVYAFASRCGWSKTYQEQIERNLMRSLSLDAITIIIQVFADIGVIITDSI